MIALDTNILVRYATRDDEAQFAAAARLMATLSRTNQGFLGTVVFVETWWVLVRAYRYAPQQVVSYFNALLDSEELVAQQPDIVRGALRDAASGVDFADSVIVRTAAAGGCDSTVTFDRRAAKRAGMTLLES